MELKSRARDYFKSFQEQVCQYLTKINGQGFHEDQWTREGGGGGKTRVFSEGGSLLEKGGVNFSEVYGQFPPEFAKSLPEGEGLEFYATGTSLVLHPKNPFAPTVHANYRYLQRGSSGWFGGGADLTPYYPYEEDAIHFHKTHKDALDAFGNDKYAQFKKNCDQYFYLPHRKETRGIGGIFFDYVTEASNLGKFENQKLPQSVGMNFEKLFEMVQSCAQAFLKAYAPIAEKRMNQPYSDKEKEFQEIRRGRYVEFNLIYDRGTTFGLKTNGRVESILMSLPLKARWIYDYKPVPGSREAELQKFLTPRDWLL
jgi:coproporphyrinogen III oxidase